jgi:uncharacterized protein involved in exopolysaccharide biosynthesis
MENQLMAISFRDLAFVVFRRKWSALFVFFATVIGSVIWLWVIRDDLYVTQGKVLIKLGSEQAPPPTVMGANPMVVAYRSQDVNSEIDILRSTDLIARIVDRLGLDKPRPPAKIPEKLLSRLRYQAKEFVGQLRDRRDEWFITIGLRERLSPRERTTALLQDALNVQAQRDSNVVVAQLKLPQRVGGSLVLQALLDEYQLFRLKAFESQGMNVFRLQTERNAAELHHAEDTLQRFEQAADVTALTKQEEGLLDQIARTRTVLKDAEGAYQEASAKTQLLEKEVDKPEPNFGWLGEFERDSFPQKLLIQLADLEKEREKLRLTDLDTSERVNNNRGQFRALAGMLAANVRSVMLEKQADYELRKAALERLQRELKTLHDKQKDWASLKRRSSESEGIYTFYRRKLEETRANDALEKNRVSNIAIIERPMDALQPTGTKKTTLFGLALVAAIFASLAWISIGEFFDHRIYTREELEKHVQAPVLAVIARGRPLKLFRAAGRHRHSIGGYAGAS